MRTLLPVDPPVTVALVGVDPSPAPTVPTDGEDPGYNSPGVVGFLVTFALVVACIPLFMSMVRKIRGVRTKGDAAPDDGATAPGEGTAPR